MDRSKVVAIITGVISLLLAIGYLLLVQILDFRGDMQPAPLSTIVSTKTMGTNGFMAQPASLTIELHEKRL